jgi:hypothetical protein
MNTDFENTTVHKIIRFKQLIKNWQDVKMSYQKKGHPMPMAEYNEYINQFTNLRSQFKPNNMMYEALTETIDELKANMHKTPRTPRTSKGGRKRTRKRTRKKSRKRTQKKKKTRKRKNR